MVSLTMENCTNCSVNDPNLAGPGFGAFLIIMLLVVVTAIVLNVTIITALCVAHSVNEIYYLNRNWIHSIWSSSQLHISPSS